MERREEQSYAKASTHSKIKFTKKEKKMENKNEFVHGIYAT